MAMIRTFIAFDTPAEFKGALSEVQRELRGVDADVRWETADKFHATIKFLGATDEGILPEISRRIGEVVSGYRPMELRFDTLGYFPNSRNPRVFWAGCAAPHIPLEEMKEKLDLALAEFGFEVEKRAFHPHITLGRFKSDRGAKYLISKAEKINFVPFTIHIGEILLMKSVLQPSGSLYSVLQTYSLI